MSLAVIIPARNAERVLPRTLAALAGALEVVVVDNGSTDTTAATALALGARVVHEPRPSRPRARNAGARATRQPKLLFLDAGCVPQAGWLDAMAAALDAHALAGGRVALTASEPPSAIERFDLAWRFRQRETIEQQRWGVTANLGIRRALLDELGGFDEAFRHAGEDVDLCLRAAERGHPPVYVDEAVVTHDAATRLGSVLRRAARQGHGSTQLHRRFQGQVGRRDWRHPRPIVTGDWATRRFGIEDPELTWIARADYAGRVAGSAWAALRRAR